MDRGPWGQQRRWREPPRLMEVQREQRRGGARERARERRPRQPRVLARTQSM